MNLSITNINRTIKTVHHVLPMIPHIRYQVCEKWLKDRKKAGRALSTDELKHYMKIVVALRETIRIMKEIDKAIPSWPFKS